MTRIRSNAARLADLDQSLRDMLRMLDARPVPSRVMAVVEQLDDQPAVTSIAREKRTSRS